MALLVLSVQLVVAGRATAAEDPREVTARAKFASGDYEEAAQIFARLFAEKRDAVYLRNIGRCYQRARQPERAIGAFQEYLLQGRLSRQERLDIDRFIKEMRELKAQQALAAPSPSPSPSLPAVAPQPTPSPAATPRPPASEPPPGPQVALRVTPKHPPPPSVGIPLHATDPRPADPSIESPVYTRWWFWTAAGAVVAAGVVTAVALGRKNGGDNGLSCRADYYCP